MHEHVHGHESTHGSAGHDESDHEHGHGGLGKYVAVFIALCFLTTISFGASLWMGPDATPAQQAGVRIVMIAVSCCKALLVMLFFMHLLWEANWKYVLTIPASIMSIFLMLMLFPDVLDRTRQYAEERWLYAAEPRARAAHETSHVPGATEHKTAPAAEHP